MKKIAIVALLILASCHRYTGKPAPNADASAPTDAGAKPILPMSDGGSHKLGAIGRQINIVAGTGITATAAENGTTHEQDWTISSTVTGGVSSVTGAGATFCAPTTGAVTCTTGNQVPNGLTGSTSFTLDGVVIGNGVNALFATSAGTTGTVLTGVTGNQPVFAAPAMSSVTGGTGISVSPTTGAAVVTLQTPVTAPNGGTGLASPAAHSIPITEGGSAFSLIASFTANHPLLAQGAGVDPNWAGYALAAPGTAGNVLTSDGTDWNSKPLTRGTQNWCSAGSTSFPGTGPIALCNVSLTTPNDGVAHNYLFTGHAQLYVSSIITATFYMQLGIGVGSVTFSSPIAYASVLANAVQVVPDAMSWLTTLAPNTTFTINLVANLVNAVGGSNTGSGPVALASDMNFIQGQ